MKQCPYCNSMLADEAKFCVECGKLLPQDAPVAAAVPEAAAAQEPVVLAEPIEADTAPAFEAPAETPADMPVITTVPPKQQMLSTFQYVALSLLYGLPLIGLVFLFLFGAGHPKNMSLKRFSAAMLILRLAFWIVVLALLMVAMIKNGRLLSDALGQLVPAVTNLLKAMFA